MWKIHILKNDNITDTTFSTIISNYKVNIINNDIMLNDMYESSKTHGDCVYL